MSKDSTSEPSSQPRARRTAEGLTQDSDAEIRGLIYRRYIQRRDIKARQLDAGAYNPVHSRWTHRDIRLHLDGKATLGHYTVDQEGRTRVLAFDIDFDKDFSWEGREVNPRQVFGTDHPARSALTTRIRALADGLAWALKRRHPHLHVAASFSGSKGIHVLGSFPGPTTAQVARETANDVLDWFGCFDVVQGNNFYKHVLGAAEGLTLEVYPKQETVGTGGFGNLLRLPLGINRKTGRPSFFYDLRAPIDRLVPIDPLLALRLGLDLR